MLLKSWAMPPASRPIDSIFWAWSSCALERLAGGDVDDRGEDLRAVGGLDRREADLDRELGAVLAPTGQVEPDAHRSGDRMRHEAVAVADVAVADALGQEQLDRLADELGRGDTRTWTGPAD